MAQLPQKQEPTIGDAIRDAINDGHAAGQDDGFRAHLGASQLGKRCERALWYGFRWVTRISWEGRMLRLFRRGHNEEPIFVADLELVGAEVLPENPATGEQWQYAILNGHVGGSCDGFARNVPNTPGPVVTEYKTHSAKSFRRLIAAKEKGELSPVKTAKPEHYSQMQLYMGWSGFSYALYMAVNKDNDDLYVEIVAFDEIEFGQLQAKAERIVRNPAPPARASDDRESFVCRFCDHVDTCHGEKVAAMNCRTCISATPNLEGVPWSCALEGEIGDSFQRDGCNKHRYIPDLVPFAKAVEASEDRAIKYELIPCEELEIGPGEHFYNGYRDDGHYPSNELEALTPSLIRDAGLALLRDKFEGTLEPVGELKFDTMNGDVDFFAVHHESDCLLATSDEDEFRAFLEGDPLCEQIDGEIFYKLIHEQGYSFTDNREIPF